MAAKDIPKGTPSMIIPIDWVVNSHDPYPLSPYLDSLSSECLLIYRLLWDRFSTAPTKPISKKFTEIIPETYHTYALWNETERQWMHEYSIQFFEYNHSFVLQDEFFKAKQILEKLDFVPKELLELKWFEWGYGAVISRTWSYPLAWIKLGRGEEVTPDDYAIRTTALYPVAENVNHCTVPSKERKPHILLPMAMKDNWAAVVSQFNFKAGQEFCIEYDEDTNGELLFKHGFVLEKNYLEEYYIRKTTDRCTEKRMKEKCQWTLNSYEVNKRFVEFLADGKGNEVGLKKYLNEVSEILEGSKYSLRDLNRLLSSKENPREDLAVRYGIGQRMLLEQQIKLAERELMMIYSERLHI
mmetsp:Transcript_3050/g.2760  ORF Transcript_3050/g.2760 Transcript_3050/m.2760 type:complete len:355 (+) Transcript_3050:118-1182(+)|eukprot:CAMPEP_0202949012 /NCGR_PEP_ID=MMETSP1395-20130829/14859_1 /ASSEMBLY_ACC=CAM_ASM_000871 /TAXON_ID=5961 /ORGANISM="Blepharisma japonicum, Strain Stock R1072" /LENGTH=354 /DNA_ID=CAMNT_0049651645 /DNA_START=118 /DNA_END=1182 /DNA_ORIENTATION=-